MRKIIIRVPNQKLNKFTLRSKGWRWKGYLRASSLLNALGRRLPPQLLREKTCVKVNYGSGYINETLASQDTDYVLRITACFLEDYLSRSMARKYGV